MVLVFVTTNDSKDSINVLDTDDLAFRDGSQVRLYTQCLSVPVETIVSEIDDFLGYKESLDVITVNGDLDVYNISNSLTQQVSNK